MEKLVVSNVYKNYGSVEAVKGISFAVNENEFVTIVGPSGCGKSSTLRMIAGLESITEGDIFLDGQRINDITPRDRNIALAFESYALYPHMTVSRNIAFPLETRRVPRSELESEVNSTLDRLHLSGLRDMKPPELSSGQQQRTSLGRALIRPASVYLLDEPLSHLDVQERGELRTELQRIQKLNNITFILVTHDQLEALEMSDRIIVMNQGEIQQIGTPEDLYADPDNLFVADFIGEPPMNFLHGTLEVGANGSLNIRSEQSSFEAPRDAHTILSQHVDDSITLGVRPADVELCANSDAGCMEATVFSTEDLGEVVFVIVERGSTKFLVECKAGTKIAPGDLVAFRFAEGQCCFFTASDGKRIR